MQDKLSVLQFVYIRALADAVYHFGEQGVLEQVEERNRDLRAPRIPMIVKSMRIQQPEQAFTITHDIVNCAPWKIEKDDNGFTAVCKSCKLCAMVKQMGGPSPCRLYCLDPIQAMVQQVDGSLSFETLETLFESDACRVKVG